MGQQGLQDLSEREKESLVNYLFGLPSKVSAKVMGISNRTVEKHLDNIRLKLNMDSLLCLRRQMFAS